MICVVQRVMSASVVVGAVEVGRVGRGLMVLVGIHRDDTPGELEWMATRLAGLRIFSDEAGKMNLSVGQVGGGILLVPNFTLCAQAGKGHRPSFVEAKAPAEASAMFDALAARIAGTVLEGGGRTPVGKGVFGADMQVSLVNDGPVTIILDSAKRGGG